MATGFIYVVTTVTRHYEQQRFCNVPTEWKNRLYFGPCKREMRPSMDLGDYVFGISGSKTNPRRIVFVAKLKEDVTYASAYERLEALRGPSGPIHVRRKPSTGTDRGDHSKYEYIPGAMHQTDWDQDLRTEDHDKFFICEEPEGRCGLWLGASGPEVDGAILVFLRTCSVHGRSVPPGALNEHSTPTKPVVYHPPGGGDLCAGLHLETSDPEGLLALCNQRIDGRRHDERRPDPGRSGTTSCCG